MPVSLPDYDSLPRRSGLPCAWDVWRPGGDVFGCLNLLTEERAAGAARLVTRGAVFPLDWSMGLPDPPLLNRSRYRHDVTGSETSVGHDDVLDGWLAEPSGLVAVGFEAGEDLARTLWNHHVAAVGTDTPAFEAWPLGHGLSREAVQAYRSEQVRLHEIFAHTVLLPMLGLPLGELFALEALADDCATDGHYEFMLTSAPLNLPNGVASPPCALAIK